MKKSYFTLGLVLFFAFSPMLYASSFRSNLWTGFYGGLEGGYIFNHATVSSQHLGFTDESGTCNGQLYSSSFFPGAQLGYSKELSSKLVVGLESEFTYNFNQSETYRCVCPFGDANDTFTFKNRSQASLIGKVGYALEFHKQNFLPFLIAGVSIANLGLSYSNESSDSYVKNELATGWIGGGGIEWSLAKHWSLRTEYFYADYGHALALSIPMIYGLTDPNGHGNITFSTSNILVAINYWI